VSQRVLNSYNKELADLNYKVEFALVDVNRFRVIKPHTGAMEVTSKPPEMKVVYTYPNGRPAELQFELSDQDGAMTLGGKSPTEAAEFLLKEFISGT
jgi:hypothetical protein